ncbi:MAG: SCO family protein [Bacteroidetes bacterium]|nr:SCO family protein [Bacteroidota bacterium]MBP6314384.1 SCO family protein [Chitinophagaceae bacterium]
MKNKTSLFLLVFFMLLGVGFLSYYYFQYKQVPKHLPTYGNPGHHVEPFSFTNQEGKTITEKDLEGKIYVVEYFFTTCEGICPKMNDNMAKVYATFRGQNDVAILSHTVDPETDTVEQLKRYSLKFDADPTQWNFVTGDKMELYKMAINSYLVTAVEDTTQKDIMPDFIHSEKFVLVDKEKHIRGSYDGTSPAEVAKLISDIKELQKEYAE